MVFIIQNYIIYYANIFKLYEYNILYEDFGKKLFQESTWEFLYKLN